MRIALQGVNSHRDTRVEVICLPVHGRLITEDSRFHDPNLVKVSMGSRPPFELSTEPIGGVEPFTALKGYVAIAMGECVLIQEL